MNVTHFFICRKKHFNDKQQQMDAYGIYYCPVDITPTGEVPITVLAAIEVDPGEDGRRLKVCIDSPGGGRSWVPLQTISNLNREQRVGWFHGSGPFVAREPGDYIFHLKTDEAGPDLAPACCLRMKQPG
ncbi:MAG: hypothetical protein AAB074_06765 [Planctomycetota bacterium]